MWAKTFAGFFVGLLLYVTLTLNMAFLLPIPRDVYMLIGFVGGFVLWAGIAAYFYSVSSLKKPLLVSAGVLVVSGGINALFITEVV